MEKWEIITVITSGTIWQATIILALIMTLSSMVIIIMIGLSNWESKEAQIINLANTIFEDLCNENFKCKEYTLQDITEHVSIDIEKGTIVISKHHTLSYWKMEYGIGVIVKKNNKKELYRRTAVI